MSSPARGRITVGALCERLRQPPADHVGARSPRTLHGHLLGYDSALRDHDLGEVIDEIGLPFKEWIAARMEMTAEHESRLSARSHAARFHRQS